MKKVLVVLVMFSVIILTSCTDSSLERLEERNETETLQSTNP
ncbi:hypothetical protein [Tenacibaculum ovolyticum]